MVRRLLNIENFENSAPLLMMSVRDSDPDHIGDLAGVFNLLYNQSRRAETRLGLPLSSGWLRRRGRPAFAPSRPGHHLTVYLSLFASDRSSVRFAPFKGVVQPILHFRAQRLPHLSGISARRRQNPGAPLGG
jgi:hypothetical protein